MVSESDVLTLYNFLALSTEPEKSDAIFLFGHHQFVVPQVWERAAQLYKLGFAEKILVTGGDKKGDGGSPEADAILKDLKKRGVPANAIITEVQAKNTLENVIFGIPALQEKGLVTKRLILVAKPFHMRRCFATFKKQFSGIELSLCPPQGDWRTFIDRPTLEDYTLRLVDELDRIVVYGEKGHLEKQDIPQEVSKAANRLRKILSSAHS